MFLSYCSANEPLVCAYCETLSIKPSAYKNTALYIVVYVLEAESYVPAVTEGTRSLKNAREVEVTVIEPVVCHT